MEGSRELCDGLSSCSLGTAGPARVGFVTVPWAPWGHGGWRGGEGSPWQEPERREERFRSSSRRDGGTEMRHRKRREESERQNPNTREDKSEMEHDTKTGPQRQRDTEPPRGEVSSACLHCSCWHPECPTEVSGSPCQAHIEHLLLHTDVFLCVGNCTPGAGRALEGRDSGPVSDSSWLCV